ncbi:MAG TPA: type II secretion system protein GspC [Candidatus Acidoferrum sp.]|nr:type II secretion system protein GspC [Candidatus Acidoferrum sp.]
MHAQTSQRRVIAGSVNLPVLAAAVLMVALVLRLWWAADQWSTLATLPDAGANVTPVTSRTVDVAAVQTLALFGAHHNDNGAAALANLATTELDLGLEGVVLALPKSNSRALIVSGGRQHSYRIGDSLPGGGNVTLGDVAADHVVIRNNGIEQVLWLYNKDKNRTQPTDKAAAGNRAAAVVTPTAAQAAALLQAAPQQIRKAAARLAEIIAVEPAVGNAHLLGYRVSPGPRLKEFVQLGFKQNDILTSVNGISLTDMANLPELYNLMNRPTDVSFSLLRDGQPLTLQMTMTP